MTKSFTDTPCNSGGIPGSRLDDFGDPDTGDLVVDIGDFDRTEVSILANEAELGVKGDSDPNEGCDVVCVMSDDWKELSKLALPAYPSLIGLCPNVGAGDGVLPIDEKKHSDITFNSIS